MKQYRCDHCGVVIDRPMMYDIVEHEFGGHVSGTGEPITLCDEHKRELGEWLMAYRNSQVDSPDEKKAFKWGFK